MYNEIIKFV